MNTAPTPHAASPETDRPAPSNPYRRVLLGGAVAGGVVAATGILAATTTNLMGRRDERAGPTDAEYPLHGVHQSGIVTPAQDRLHFAAFDLMATTGRAELISLLRDWTAAAEQLMAGREIGEFGAVGGGRHAPPEDTGEALGLPPAGLTITFGFGPSLFLDADGTDRFGLADRRPQALIELPHFSGDRLEEWAGGGDLCVQACSHDPQVAVHAVRNLTRIAFGRARLRWSQLGFGRTSSTSHHQDTPRNLFGFKDGTANIMAEDEDLLARHVWVDPADDPGAAWMAGGTYLVTRKIRMAIETWDRASLGEQERVTGRSKLVGAPLSGGDEFSEPDFAATGLDGVLLIHERSHVRLAHADQNDGVKMLRRGYNYVDGSDELGRLDAGLFFICFQRDTRTQFVPMQRRLAEHDDMMEYLLHVSSGHFAIPPGIGPGQYIGELLFA